MAVSLPEVLALLRTVIERDFPGFPLREMVLRGYDGQKMRLPIARAAGATQEQPGPTAGPSRRHSEDFRSVSWDGAAYAFTMGQAAVIRRLWQAWEDNTPEVSQAALLEAAESEGDRLRDLFRSTEGIHSAWGILIVPGQRRGTFQLAV